MYRASLNSKRSFAALTLEDDQLFAKAFPVRTETPAVAPTPSF